MSVDLWLGVESTVNRVGNTYFDQVERTGHHARPEDLDLFASLGVKAIRYPVLWERTAPDGTPDWTWPDERLNRLRDLGMRPIVGLLHHGSGPKHTALTDRQFADKFSQYALSVAQRYPWVEDYIPVNEPLTTARFSGLYGHWYPHGTDDLTFAKALLAQCRASILAIRQIRSVNPSAKFIQTEDLGKTFSVSSLQYQADFENERRWLTFDLIGGMVDTHHPMWSYLRWAGITRSEILWFTENALPPDIIGINHYLTSDRYLDNRICCFPAHTHGGNGREAYADVEAVRVEMDEILGPDIRIRETWDRYHRPLVVSEAHLGCHDEAESARWLLEVYKSAEDQQNRGVDVRAVTAWAALGAYDWDSLVVRNAGHYESGVFDSTCRTPRPTLAAGLIRELAAGILPTNPVLEMPGWWRRPDRLLYLQRTAASLALI